MAGLLPLMIQLQFVASSGRILASTSARRSEYNIEQWVEPSPQLYIYIHMCIYILCLHMHMSLCGYYILQCLTINLYMCLNWIRPAE